MSYTLTQILIEYNKGGMGHFKGSGIVPRALWEQKT